MASRSGTQVKPAKKSHPEAVVGNETLLNIDKLPTEMLHEIFEKMIELKNGNDSNSNSELAGHNPSYLNCREVNSHWKSGIESVLEKKSISTWKTMPFPVTIHNMTSEPRTLGHVFVIKPKGEHTPMESAYLPPALELWEEKENPFPSRSLVLTSDLAHSYITYLKSRRARGTQVIGLVPFFSMVGEHLTSLILATVTLSSKTLVGILENTPELKALSLIRVLIPQEISPCAQLPALRNLKHVQMFQVFMLEKGKKYDWSDFNYDDEDKKKLCSWILQPYKGQLLTLDSDGQGCIGTEANFGNLERLFVSNVYDLSFLHPELFIYSRLKSLFLTNIKSKFDGERKEWFQRNIGPFAETLTELQLDIPSRILGKLLAKEPMFKISPEATQKKINKVVFQEMKALAITFPKLAGEAQLIKNMIKEFPNLEALTFLIRGGEYQVAGAQNLVDQEEYGKVCLKLKKIRIRDLANTRD
ncbi:unnamed protein product [Orchesella dallaii]|uniref:F-box domain-containing protein n=1 Tax=Orchesella dallaii TaxID=48710 RepID=A0ABP1RJV0_9HEXA